MNSVRLLHDFLRAHGYKELEIVSEYKAAGPGGSTRVDVVIVDPLTGTPLLTFEIKTGPVKHDDP